MKTKNIFKALAVAMLMPTMLLTTACSSEDDLAANNNEITNKKGFALPVTINVTREGDATTRATYNESTGKLAFSAGDKLLVRSYNGGSAGMYAGVLDWVSGGTFSGTITTQNPYTGTIDALLSGSGSALAVLLPAGYGDYGFLSTEGNVGAYYDTYDADYTKAFVASTTEKTAKALAVEQFSFEYANYSGGFALEPNNAILNFTITGLTPSTKVTATLAKSGSDVISGQVTTDGSGNATFAMAIQGNVTFIKDLTLTVGGNVFSFTDSSVLLESGHVYNISRNVLIVNPVVGQVIGDNGKNYDNAAAAEADGATAVAKICYVGSDNGEAAPYNHGLALALSNANGGISCKWKTSNTDAGHTKQTDSENFASESGLQYNDATHNSDTYPAFKAAIANNGTAAPTGCSAWFLASGYQWQKMAGAAGLTNLGLTEGAAYWSSSEHLDSQAWVFLNGNWYNINKNTGFRVLACLAF